MIFLVGYSKGSEQLQSSAALGKYVNLQLQRAQGSNQRPYT